MVEAVIKTTYQSKDHIARIEKQHDEAWAHWFTRDYFAPDPVLSCLLSNPAESYQL